ncbi:MAG: hypothetical protein POH28_00985 [Acidocella sp.]|nr:hypothetical protein [Acidocella sp.]
MDFIFMLTNQDQTIPDCLDTLSLVAPLGLRHVGFKDIGVDAATMQALTRRIKAQGAMSYLEVVATSSGAMRASAHMGVALGVDCLLGGTLVSETLAILRGTGIEYYPFPGIPVGHPTQLDGDDALIEAHSAAFVSQGCAGVDLLAYRARTADPLALTRAARRGCADHGRLICAGGVDSRARINALAAAGADAFTIGSAVFNGSFAPHAGGVLEQLRVILKT